MFGAVPFGGMAFASLLTPNVNSAPSVTVAIAYCG